jgi:hypothetical protein
LRSKERREEAKESRDLIRSCKALLRVI